MQIEYVCLSNSPREIQCSSQWHIFKQSFTLEESCLRFGPSGEILLDGRVLATKRPFVDFVTTLARRIA